MRERERERQRGERWLFFLWCKMEQVEVAERERVQWVVEERE
jgi:hypothetical protein